MRHYNLFSILSVALMLQGCGTKEFTTIVDGTEGPLVIYPDYKEVTIPANIAPLNFRYAMEGVGRVSTTFTLGDKSVTFKGTEVEWNLKKWKSFISGAEGRTITVSAEAVVDGRPVSDSWFVSVSGDAVDGWLTYRLIEPSYQMFN